MFFFCVFRVNEFVFGRNPAVVSALVWLIWAHKNNQKAIVLSCGAKQLDLAGSKFVVGIVHFQIQAISPKWYHLYNACFFGQWPCPLNCFPNMNMQRTLYCKWLLDKRRKTPCVYNLLAKVLAHPVHYTYITLSL